MLRHPIRVIHPKTVIPPPCLELSKKKRLDENISFNRPCFDRPFRFFVLLLAFQAVASAAALWATL